MYIALDEKGNRVHISKAHKEQEYNCPLCKDKVIIKDGSIRIKHYSHLKLKCQDSFSNDMSEWHYNWQVQFPEETREFVVEAKSHDVENDMEYHHEELSYYEMDMPNNQLLKHRADVLINNTVIEFQHSPLSLKEFMRRNYFYRNLLSLKVVWVFDVSDADIEYIRDSNNGELWSWKRAIGTLKYFIPQNENITVYLDFYGEELRKLKWCVVKDDDTADYKRMVTDEPITKAQFIEKYS